MTIRQQFRAFLKEKIIDAEAVEPPSQSQSLQKLLHQAIDGLDALDRGEVQEIFSPAPTRAWGTMPATVKRYQFKALGYITLLHEMGWKVKEATKAVAEAYSETTDVVTQWRKTLKKDKSLQAQELTTESMKSYTMRKKLQHSVTISGVLKAINATGQKYKDAKIYKKQMKPVKQGKYGKQGK